jgi:hypothetical protein
MKSKFILLVCVVILSSFPAKHSAAATNVDKLFADPIAYPRTTGSSLAVARSKYFGKNIYYFETSLGKDIFIYTFSVKIDKDELYIRPGIEASTWMTLGYSGGAFPLLLQDFYMASSIRLKYKNVFGFLKFNHISSHLGDGMNKLSRSKLNADELRMLDEYDNMAQNYNMSITLVKPFVYSRDFMSSLLGINYNMWGFNIKNYIHVGYAHKIIPRDLGRYFIGPGHEITYSKFLFGPYYAQDVTWNDDVQSLDYSGQFGITVIQNRNLNMKLALSLYNGSDRRGQMLGKRLNQLSFGVLIH